MKRLSGKFREADLEDAFGLRQQGKVACTILRVDPGDLGKRFLERAAVVKVAAIIIVKAIPWLEWNKLHMI